MVAVFVDKDIYKSTESDIKWYASEYIQSHISDTKAIVLPIDTKNFAAKDISAMLENMYFDGVKGSSSDLLGVILLGNIPLPVVEQNGFIYPSIYPYVDFEQQQFVYNANQNYFVYNNNPNGQPEIWHGLINFGKDTSAYIKYFEKLKTYVKSPSTYVAPRLWYDDFIGMKSTFAQDTLPLYLNNFVFTEDMGYHRYTNLMLDYLKTAVNAGMGDVVKWLAQSASSPELSSALAGWFDNLWATSVPTMMLSTIIKEMVKGYDSLYPGVFSSQMRDNTQAASRWYKTTSWGLVDAVDAHVGKIVLKDSWVLGNVWSGIAPLLVNYNNKLEKQLDDVIKSKKWSLAVPVLDTYSESKYHKDSVLLWLKKYCSVDQEDTYQNYYFWKKASDIKDPQELTIFRGTFRNSTGLQNESVYSNTTRAKSGFTQSLGASYGVFDTQVEANRWYNILSAPRENDVYNAYKKPLYVSASCADWSKFLWFKLYCKSYSFTVDDDKQLESPAQFAQRNRWWASSLNLNQELMQRTPAQYVLQNYNYKNSQSPIYDLWWSTAVPSVEKDANSVAAIPSYWSLIKIKTREWDLDYPLYVKWLNLPGYAPSGDYNYFLWNKITTSYSDYFQQFALNKTDNDTIKRIYVPNVASPAQRKAWSPVGWKCGNLYPTEYAYNYVLIDSVIKNIAPSIEQINGFNSSPFVNWGLFKKHYDFFTQGLSSFYEQFSVIKDSQSSLDELNKLPPKFLNAATALNTWALPVDLLAASDAILSGVDDIFDLHYTVLEEAMPTFYSVPTSSEALGTISSLNSYFTQMKQAEALAGKKTQFLNSWMTALQSSWVLIKTTANTLSDKYPLLTSSYSSLISANYGTGILQNKREWLRAKKDCWNTTVWYTGAYGEVCRSLDITIWKINGYYASGVSLWKQPLSDTSTTTVNPFNDPDLTNQFKDKSWLPTFDTFLASLTSSVTLVSQVDFPLVPWLNQATKDRPIDSERNTTFKWLGWDIVKFVYPNLYDVDVYDSQSWSLVLKTPEAIQKSITLYLINKAKEYNSILWQEQNKSAKYYTDNKSAFDKLTDNNKTKSLLNLLASPSNRTTEYLPETYFVTTIKDQIPQIAELLYYQSLPSYLRTVQSNVSKDLNGIRNSFDVNKKISYVMSGYLTKHADLGTVTTPAYLSAGYEVAYINSDGNDYIPQQSVPEFISKLQKNQLNSPTANIPLVEQEPAYAKTINDCNLDANYSALIFDIKKWNSPWIDALKCRWKNIPTSTKFSMTFTMGPSPAEFIANLSGMFETWKSSFSQMFTTPKPVFSWNLAEYWTDIALPVPVLDSKSVKTVDFVFPSSSTATTSVVAGTQIPFNLLAKDFSGNVLSSTASSYYLSISTWGGVFVDGQSQVTETIPFTDFGDLWIYQAPRLTGTDSKKIILSLMQGSTWVAEKILNIEPADFTISSNGNNLYAKEKSLAGLKFTLTGSKNYPKLHFSFQTKSLPSKPLDTPVNIVSDRGLVTPWITSTGGFKANSSFLIEKWVLDVTLMPSFVAWTDTLSIEVPWLDVIKIPLYVIAGSPSKVNLTVNNALLTMWDQFTWSLSVSDAWGNALSGAKVNLKSSWPIHIPTQPLTISDTPYIFTGTTEEPGWIAYIISYLEGVSIEDPSSDYKQITVQKPFLPEKNLNVMYLNLFGSDWWNQRAYGSSRTGYVAGLITDSSKLLAVTTQLIDPSALKKFTVVVGQNGQVHPFVTMTPSLINSGNSLITTIPDQADIRLSDFQNIRFDAVQSFQDFVPSNITEPTFILLQQSSDSNLIVGKNQISSGEQILINSATQEWNTWVTLTMEPDVYQGYSLWDLSIDGNKLGTLLFVLPSSTALNTLSTALVAPQEYWIQTTFADGSTNGMSGLWIYTTQTIFEKQGYNSIEDSANYKLGMWFLGDFKNITLFGDGKSVGEATIPYASSFLINYGDPLLKRISDNVELAQVPLDTGIGTQIYSDPNKTIFKVISADINNDGLKDMVIVFTDGTVKILKNYGGTNPYRDVGELFRLIDGIKDIQVGDVDNNNYADLIVRTDKDQVRVYTNDRWVFDVDGRLVCLNTNAQDGQVSTDPSHVSDMQIFFEDMDKDGVTDIVTNDTIGDVKIFYGGLTKGEPNYLSKLSYTCDPDWYTRQKTSSIVVKRFGLSINPDLYIQDTSMMHIKWWNIISDADTSLQDTDYSDASLPENPPAFLDWITDPSKFSATSLVGWFTNYLQTESNKSLLTTLVVSPISNFTPAYESPDNHDAIGYKSLIALSGDANISVYKQYQDENGGILLDGDQVKVTLTFLWLTNNIKASYVDRLAGPWMVPVDDNDHIVSWKLEQWTYDTKNVSWGYDDGIQFVMDNINLSKWDRIVVSYLIRYQSKPSITITIKPIPYPNSKLSADIYPDILMNPQDSCKKYRWDFMNTSSLAHRSYEEIFDTSLQDSVNSYFSQWSTEGKDLLDGVFPGAAPKVDTWWKSEDIQNSIMNFVSTAMQGKSLTESWSVSDLFTSDTNISLNLDFVDKAMAPVMAEVDKAMNALCQWFKLGRWWCGQPPVPFNLIPFNQAFLAPGEYHLFGCTPKLPNPLAPVFAYINKMLGGWMPVLYFPGTLPIPPLPPIPMISTSFIPIPMKGIWDGFGLPGILPMAGGVYPSQVRLYLVPTLTLQLGVAICFGPYSLWSNIPKLLRDLWGNCVVTAFPLYQNSCGWGDSNSTEPTTEVLDSWMTDLATNGSCQNPVQVGKTTTSSANTLMMSDTVTSPVYMSSRWAASTSWTASIPGGNFGGMWAISFNDKPTKVSPATYASPKSSSTPSFLTSSDETSDMLLAGVTIEPGKPINLKVLGANAKGIIAKIAKDWLGRQTKYIMNNLTKLTISITLPNVADLGKWFDQINSANYKEISATEKANDKAFTWSRNVSGSALVNKIAGLASKQNFAAASDFVNNPFDSMVTMFQQVPLIRLQSKDIIINVPMVTTEDVLKYTNYLKSRLNTQQKILKQWVDMVADVMYVCGKVSPQDAKQELADLPFEEQLTKDPTLWLTWGQQTKLDTILVNYKKFLTDIANKPDLPAKANVVQDVSYKWKEAQAQFPLFWQRLPIKPFLKVAITALTNKKTANNNKLSQQDQLLLNRIQSRYKQISFCSQFSANIDPFTTFYTNATLLVTNVKQNIQVLQEYKRFPMQLSKWMAVADTYLSDITSFLSNTVVVLMQWMSTNAKIYSKWIDAMILIVSSIKTWQILIDFSVNWGQKCGKCSRDSYGSYSCGLSFLLDKIKLPILPIPPFKIPNIYVDLSHIDLWMTVALPRFRFVPVGVSLPKIPDLPSPPNINLDVNLGLNLDFWFNFSIPQLPVLPSPPTLPDLPSFIPKVDFALPTLPPAPKIPNLIPEIWVTLDFASSLAKIFCIVKQWVGLVGEKWIKSKVEQLTQRTWDVKAFDFLDQTVSWKKDPALYGFDFKLDGYINFKMNFDPFYNLLNWIASGINEFTSKTQNSVQTYLTKQSVAAQKAVTDFSTENLKDLDFKIDAKPTIDLNTAIFGANTASSLDYDVAAAKLKKDLAYFATKVDDPQIKDKIKTVRSIVNQNIKITPETKKLLAVQNQIQTVISAKQKEIRWLASHIDNYTKFLAQVDRQDAVLVSNDTIDTTYTVNLFSTDDASRKLLASQENPYKLALDTNAGLVERYVNTLKSTTAEDFGVDKETYNKTSDYMAWLSSKIKDVYTRLDLAPIAYDSCGMPRVVESPKTTSSSSVSRGPLLAANTSAPSSTPASSSSSTDASYDLAPYVRGVFVPKTTASSGIQMVNVVKSDWYIEKIGSNYQVFSGNASQDLNQDGLVDVLSWDSHGVYVKYSHQHVIPKVNLSLQSYDKNYYVYDGWSRYIPSYHAVLEASYPDGDGYVSFGNGLEINLVHPYPEVKNFVVTAQDFDSVQFAWTSHTSLWYTPDAYLVKLNQRIDTFTDKDSLFDLIGKWAQDLLWKSYVLFLPKNTNYTGSFVNISEKAYTLFGDSFENQHLITDLLPGGAYSGSLLAVKYYDPEQETITSSLSEIPRHRQYAKIVGLKNIGNVDAQNYVVASPWSNQIVVWRQLLADSVGPSSTISLYRPSIKQIVSEGSDHKGYIGTTYSLQAHRKDNVAVSKMRIQQGDQIIAFQTGLQETGFIELSGLNFTGNVSLDFVFGAEDFQGNRQTDPVRLTIETPEISVKDVPLSWASGNIVAELSHDIDEWLVTFQRERNQRRVEITGSLSNTLWWFNLKPLQTILTGGVFSLGQDVGFYDMKNNQIGSLSPSGNLKIFPAYDALYKIQMDLTSSLPALRVLDIKQSDTLFWVHLPPKQLISLKLGKQEPLYTQVPLQWSTFGGFDGGVCVKDSTQQCLVYVSKVGELYIPQQFIWSLRATYFYDATNQTVVYTLRDMLSTEKDPYIAQITLQVNVLH